MTDPIARGTAVRTVFGDSSGLSESDRDGPIEIVTFALDGYAMGLDGDEVLPPTDEVE